MRLASSALGCFLRAGYGCVAWVLVATTCLGAEQQFRPSLERYLKGIGYEPIRLKRGLHNDLVVWGELHGKERSFLVDTGCSVSVLDRGTARRLKTLGELGLQLDDSFLGKVIEPSFVLMDLK